MKIITKIIFIMACLFLLTPQLKSFAYDFGGPWVVWVNLSNKTNIENMIRKHINNTNSNIYDNGLFLFKLRPTGITNELVKKAVIDNDNKAIQQLDEIMHRDFLDFYGGFDGIIVYDEERGPRLSQIVRDKRTIVGKKIEHPDRPDVVVELFNKFIPPNAKKN